MPAAGRARRHGRRGGAESRGGAFRGSAGTRQGVPGPPRACVAGMRRISGRSAQAYAARPGPRRVPDPGWCLIASYDVARGRTRPARRVGGLNPQDCQLRDTCASRETWIWWSEQAGPRGSPSPPAQGEQGDAATAESPTANRQQSAAADDSRAEAEIRRALGAVMVLLDGHRRDERDRLTWCGRLGLNRVSMSDGLAFVADAGVACVGEEVHQAEGEEQQQEQAPDDASLRPGPVAHTLRHLAVAPIWHLPSTVAAHQCTGAR